MQAPPPLAVIRGACFPGAVDGFDQGLPMHLRLLLLLLLFSLSPAAEAALHKCQDASGKVRYSDRPCADAEQAETRSIAAGGGALSLADRAANLPGVHASWLDTPPHLTVSARCQGELCQCGDWQYRKNNQERSRLMAALRALPDVWDSYLRQVESQAQSTSPRNDESALAGLREAACEVRVEQELIVELFPKIIPEFFDSRALAEARVAGSENACPLPDIKTVPARDPRWDTYRECEKHRLASKRSAEIKLNHTHFDNRAFNELLPALSAPRPLRPR
jgi:hypothetical protein